MAHLAKMTGGRPTTTKTTFGDRYDSTLQSYRLGPAPPRRLRPPGLRGLPSSERRWLTCRASGGSEQGDDEPPQVMGDWRSFRAKLVAGSSEYQQTSRKATDNFRLLQSQNPTLAEEGLWCHPADPEKGGILIAAPDAPNVLKDERMWQAVVFLTRHDAQGTVGLILNRPSGVNLGSLNVPFEGPDSMQSVFQENRIYFGGVSQGEGKTHRWRWRGSNPKQQIRFRVVSADAVVAEAVPSHSPALPFDRNRLHCGGFSHQEVVNLIHGHKSLDGAQEIVPGIYCGGERDAIRAVRDDQLTSSDFRFFAGCMVWQPGQLAEEIAGGGWISAASSRSLVLKQCLGLPTPLWKEAMELMGGEYGATARGVYGDTKP